MSTQKQFSSDPYSLRKHPASWYDLIYKATGKGEENNNEGAMIEPNLRYY
jgi:hypothetical protein